MIIIKAQRFRTQEKNREDALQRLQALIRSVTQTRKKRIATKPTKGSQKKRIEGKIRKGRDKALRKKVSWDG